MHNERKDLSAFASLNVVDLMQMHMSPERMSPRHLSGTSETVRAEASLEAALQALRDVRHLLPAQGVAIVDAVLDRSVD